ncbi:Hypothetical predicted protein [Marmota monax]|uniref:PHD-type domain-containing protein n=1 Tax=Marmota monax TaxID=9995 RepID=A0A5E4BV61_MARMO|nr:hypothetical protein GHT09_006885 [Marmota monax]VTJ72871.1 Hypothetical predicted protein [Marmota monax]
MVSSDRPVSLEDEVSHSMKEMIGGCCVCSDERGWAENPLVYCDGHGCSVAVHQACYGIVQVPTGPWFCRKCESQERAARVGKEWFGWSEVLSSGPFSPDLRVGSSWTETVKRSLRNELAVHSGTVMIQKDKAAFSKE